MTNEQTAHSAMVRKLVKDGDVIIRQLDRSKANLWHMVTGIAGEAGELLDAIKKHVVYNKPLDVHNAIEELGDIEFYLEGVRQELGITREETLKANIDKLVAGKKPRYEGGEYSDEAAQVRADKAGA